MHTTIKAIAVSLVLSIPIDIKSDVRMRDTTCDKWIVGYKNPFLLGIRLHYIIKDTLVTTKTDIVWVAITN